jgi:hypothetical protein
MSADWQCVVGSYVEKVSLAGPLLLHCTYDRSACIFDREAYTDWAINSCARAARTSAAKWENIKGTSLLSGSYSTDSAAARQVNILAAPITVAGSGAHIFFQIHCRDPGIILQNADFKEWGRGDSNPCPPPRKGGFGIISVLPSVSRAAYLRPILVS